MLSISYLLISYCLNPASIISFCLFPTSSFLTYLHISSCLKSNFRISYCVFLLPIVSISYNSFLLQLSMYIPPPYILPSFPICFFVWSPLFQKSKKSDCKAFLIETVSPETFGFLCILNKALPSCFKVYSNSNTTHSSKHIS